MVTLVALPAHSLHKSLAQRMALFRDDAYAYQEANDLFRVDSWVQVLIGQGLVPASYHRLAKMMGPDDLRGALGALKASIGNAVARMPSHQEFLAQYCPAGDA